MDRRHFIRVAEPCDFEVEINGKGKKMIVNTGILKNKKYTVVGAARSGVSSAEFLVKYGADVVISDVKNKSDIPEIVEKLKPLGVTLDLGGHTEKYFVYADCIVLSPGVPFENPVIKKAVAAGVEVISEIELAYRHTDAVIVGITGSNGKTTTTALTGAILKEAGFKSITCGNIGNSFIGELLNKPDTEYFVIELSSFQLETIESFKPQAGAILNITPDHLDRYAGMEDYAAAKFRIFMNQGKTEYAVLNYDDPLLNIIGKKLQSGVLFFSMREKVDNGLFLKDDKIVFSENGVESDFTPCNILIIKGKHNVENFMAAALLAMSVGVKKATVIEAASKFKPVEHRLEFVRELNGVSYFNDSKATNVDATIKALESFDGKLILILGGKDKGSDYTVLKSLLLSKVDYLIVTGAASEKIAGQLGETVPHIVEKKFDDAVKTAMEIAEPGNIVLLAPACASFDQFKNFEERGRRFKELVNSFNGIKKRNG